MNAIRAEPPMTDEEIRERYKGCRNLKIERDENSVTVTYREPCVVCNKFHHKGSKAEKQCNFRLMCGVVQILGDRE